MTLDGDKLAESPDCFAGAGDVLNGLEMRPESQLDSLCRNRGNQSMIVLRGFLALLFVCGGLVVAGGMAGCGGDSGGEVKPSEEAKKADQNIQEGMKAYMQSKTQAKKK